MPRRTRKSRTVTRSRRTTKTRRKRGGSLWSWISKKAIPWVRKQHLISKAIGPAVGLVGGPLAGMAAGAVGNVLGNKYGFGKRRGRKKIKYRRGRGLNHTGGRRPGRPRKPCKH